MSAKLIAPTLQLPSRTPEPLLGDRPRETEAPLRLAIASAVYRPCFSAFLLPLERPVGAATP